MITQILNKKLFVSLGSQIDLYRFSQYSNSQKFHELSRPKGLIYFEVMNLLEAKNVTQKFINEFELSGSNWIGGRVVDENNNFVAQISYNGRVWENESYPCNEIMI